MSSPGLSAGAFLRSLIQGDDLTDQGQYLKRMSLYTRLLAERSGDVRVEAIMSPRLPYRWRIYHVDSADIVEIIVPDYPAVSVIHRLSQQEQRDFLYPFLDGALDRLRNRRKQLDRSRSSL